MEWTYWSCANESHHCHHLLCSISAFSLQAPPSVVGAPNTETIMIQKTLQTTTIYSSIIKQTHGILRLSIRSFSISLPQQLPRHLNFWRLVMYYCTSILTQGTHALTTNVLGSIASSIQMSTHGLERSAVVMLPSSTGLQASVELSDVTLSLSSSLYSKAVLSILIKKKQQKKLSAHWKVTTTFFNHFVMTRGEENL